MRVRWANKVCSSRSCLESRDRLGFAEASDLKAGHWVLNEEPRKKRPRVALSIAPSDVAQQLLPKRRLHPSSHPRSRDFGFQNQASCYGNKRKAHGLDNRTGPSQAAGGLCHPQLDESQHNWRIGLRIQWTSNPQTPVAWALTLNSTLSQSPKTRLKPPRHRSPQALTPHTQTRRASPQYSATSSPCRPKPPNLQTILKALQAVQSGQGADFRSCIRCQPAGSGKDTTTDLMIS